MIKLCDKIPTFKKKNLEENYMIFGTKLLSFVLVRTMTFRACK